MFIWRKVSPIRRVTLPLQKGDPLRRVILLAFKFESSTPVKKTWNTCDFLGMYLALKLKSPHPLVVFSVNKGSLGKLGRFPTL